MENSTTWAHAAIRIVAPEVGVDEISRRLQALPRYAFPKRESRFRARGIWYMWSGLDGKSKPREHLKVLVEFIRAHIEQLKELTQKYPAEVSCAFASSEGETSFMVDADMIAILAEARFNLFLSLYPPGDERDWPIMDVSEGAAKHETGP